MNRNQSLSISPATQQPGDLDYVTRAMSGATIDPSNHDALRGLAAIAATGAFPDYDGFNSVAATLCDIMAYCDFDSIAWGAALERATAMRYSDKQRAVTNVPGPLKTDCGEVPERVWLTNPSYYDTQGQSAAKSGIWL